MKLSSFQLLTIFSLIGACIFFSNCSSEDATIEEAIIGDWVLNENEDVMIRFEENGNFSLLVNGSNLAIVDGFGQLQYKLHQQEGAIIMKLVGQEENTLFSTEMIAIENDQLKRYILADNDPVEGKVTKVGIYSKKG